MKNLEWIKLLKTQLLTASEGDSQSRDSSDSSGHEIAVPDSILPPNLFVLPVNSAVIYPTLMAPLSVSTPRFISTVEEAIDRQRVIGLVLTREKEVNPKTKAADLFEVGVAVKILKRLKMPDGSVNLLVHSIRRFRVKSVLSERPHIVVGAEYLEDQIEKTPELDALTRTVISHVKQLSEVNPFFTEEMKMAMINAPGPGVVADLVAFALSLPKPKAQEFLEKISVKERFEELLGYLRREQNVAELQKKIHEDVNTKINKMQRDYFLKEQLRAIKRELGMEEDGKEKSARTYREKVEVLGMPETVKKVVLEEVSKFETLSEQSPEYNVTRNYLDIIVALPWSNSTEDNLSISHAQRVLDEDHYGLEKIKERIIEFLAIRNLKEKINKTSSSTPSPGAAKDKSERDAKGSIICLVGPPGVGKTSVGKSIARALGREFYRFSLGGMRDEAEIKGHRRTYIGAMPGKIITAMKRAGTKNPVLMLDEIDKLGQSFQGDPASALLEVLDPEQNSDFMDHYLDLPFDLSDVVFIATANNAATIPGPLLDRMEVIEIPGYTLEEKEEIAARYVIPDILQKNGLKRSQLKIEKVALRQLLSDYSREPGLRSLQKFVEKIVRKAAAQIVRSHEGRKKRLGQVRVKAEDLLDWVGPKKFYNELAERITSPGVSVGLAWTSTGGDILFIEAEDIPGTGQLRLTGKMGEVMTESANIAWSYVKNKLRRERGYTHDFYKNQDYHLHIPAGAIPKDGPSAGITMAVTLYSRITGRPLRQKLAMTGELSLVGKVLPVGGIKEKLLAAMRAGIQTVILPKQNEKDLHDVPQNVQDKLKIYWVSHVDEVFDLALEPAPSSKTSRVSSSPRTGAGKKAAAAGGAKRRKPTQKKAKKKKNVLKTRKKTSNTRASLTH